MFFCPGGFGRLNGGMRVAVTRPLAQQSNPPPYVSARRARLTLFEDEPLRLECGAELGPIVVAVESWGPPNPDRAVLVCHALTGDAHAARHGPDDRPGWWDVYVGPGRALDTNRYWVLCTNVLGGVAGTTGPGSPGPTGEPWGLAFPLVTVRDMVRVQEAALRALGVERLLLTTGGSLGGMQALEWAALFPDRVRAVAAIGATDRLSAMGIGLNAVQREALLLGLKHGDPAGGMRTARMLAMLSYRSAVHFATRFGRALQPGSDLLQPDYEPRFAIESYLRYQGDKLAARFNAWSYLTLSRAMDLFDLWADREPGRGIQAHIHLAAITTDWLFEPQDIERLANLIRQHGGRADYTLIDSPLGHDAFLIEHPDIAAWLARAVRSAERQAVSALS
jgi:homoserine O-acetyltransferase